MTAAVATSLLPLGPDATASSRSTAALFPIGNHLPIGIHGQLNTDVAELTLHVGDGFPLLQHQTRIGMSQAVWREMRRQLRFLEHAVVPLLNHNGI